MSDFRVITSVPQLCESVYAPYGYLCEPLKTPVVAKNCCITKMVYPYYDGPDILYGTHEGNELRMWDATGVTGATGYTENDCGYSEVGEGVEEPVTFFVNFGCTIKVTISGQFPVKYRSPSVDNDPWVYVGLYPIVASNYGSWLPSFTGGTNADYIDLGTDAISMQLWIRSIEATTRVCCSPDHNDCPGLDPTPCTALACDDPAAPDFAAPKGYAFSTEERTYVWTYTCDVPCGTTVAISRYGTYTYSSNAGTYVDVKVETLESCCPT